MDNFKLTPPPNGVDAPHGRLLHFGDLEGKTVRKVIECPCGLRGDLADVVIVCDDNTWLPLCATPDGSEHATIDVVSPYGYRRDIGIADILHPRELLDAELVNVEQYNLLERRLEEKKAADNAARAARLRAEAAKLDGQAD